MKAFFTLALLILVTQSALGSCEQAELNALAANSGFVVQTTVLQVGATANPEFAASRDTTVERVDAVFKTSQAVGMPVGDKLTVKVKNPENVKPGDRRILFAVGLIYGQTLEVGEVGHVDMECSPEVKLAFAQVPDPNLEDLIQDLRVVLIDQELKARLNQADLVVLGTVESIQPLQEKFHPITEHNPKWQIASLKIGRFLKLNPPSAEAVNSSSGTWYQIPRSVDVKFPGARDIMWSGVPRLKPDQEALFILKRDPSVNSNTFTALHPSDVLDISELSRVQKLLHRRQQAPRKAL